MKLIWFLSLALLFSCSTSKKLSTVINENDIRRIESVLSHDSMEGRQAFTPAIDKSTAFIANEMKKAGLHTFENAANYLQPFEMIKAEIIGATGNIGRDSLRAANVACMSSKASIAFTDADTYKIVRIHKGDNFRTLVRPLLNATENVLVLVDTSFGRNFKALQQLKSPEFKKSPNKVFVLTTDADATQFNVTIMQALSSVHANNVVGLLPGKSRPNEYVIFAGHYDHLGYSRSDSTGDSLYNGANDNASGITAMLTLAKYYNGLHNNERSILFAAFTAEELGIIGSTYFSEHINADSVTAMFNIEMIGTDSKWGINSAYITGYEKSDMSKIMEKNLNGSPFKFYPDPYTAQQLFYRSDNASLARKGVPAHTISTSKMDNEPHYHKPSDEIETLDLKNMTEVIKAIALSAQSIINGTDTPTRIEPSGLRP
jgi:hypothetical protein